MSNDETNNESLYGNKENWWVRCTHCWKILPRRQTQQVYPRGEDDLCQDCFNRQWMERIRKSTAGKK